MHMGYNDTDPQYANNTIINFIGESVDFEHLLCNALIHCYASVVSKCAGQYIDLDYSIWLWRALTPLIITFMLPLVFVLLIYITTLFLYIYKLHRWATVFSLYRIALRLRTEPQGARMCVCMWVCVCTKNPFGHGIREFYYVPIIVQMLNG